MIEINEKYLVTTNEWFVAPNGKFYKAVWGNIKSVNTDSEELGIKTNIRSTNWYIEIGNMVVAGCQIHFAIKCDEITKDETTYYREANTVKSRDLLIYNAEL